MVDIIYGIIIVKQSSMTLGNPAFDINRTYVMNRLLFRDKFDNNGYFNTPLLF